MQRVKFLMLVIVLGSLCLLDYGGGGADAAKLKRVRRKKVTPTTTTPKLIPRRRVSLVKATPKVTKLSLIHI